MRGAASASGFQTNHRTLRDGNDGPQHTEPCISVYNPAGRTASGRRRTMGEASASGQPVIVTASTFSARALSHPTSNSHARGPDTC